MVQGGIIQISLSEPFDYKFAALKSREPFLPEDKSVGTN